MITENVLSIVFSLFLFDHHFNVNVCLFFVNIKICITNRTNKDRTYTHNLCYLARLIFGWVHSRNFVHRIVCQLGGLAAYGKVKKFDEVFFFLCIVWFWFVAFFLLFMLSRFRLFILVTFDRFSIQLKWKNKRIILNNRSTIIRIATYCFCFWIFFYLK